jgi:hypothetical protein
MGITPSTRPTPHGPVQGLARIAPPERAAQVHAGQSLPLFTGALWLRDDQDAFAQSNGTTVARFVFRIGRLNLGGEVSREFGDFEPYVGATYHLTITQTQFAAGTPSLDRQDATLHVGARHFGSDTVSGTSELSKLIGRANVDEYSVNFLLRADF